MKERINGLIAEIVIEIIVVSFLLFISIILVNRQSFKSIFENIDDFLDSNYTQVFVNQNIDNNYLISIANETYTKEEYNLVLKFNNVNDKDNILVVIDNRIYKLNDFLEENNTFTIMHDEIVADIKNYDVVLYKDNLEEPIEAEFYLQNVLKV